MRRLIFFFILALSALGTQSAVAQYGYYAQPGYGYPYSPPGYGGYAPSYYYGSGYQQPDPRYYGAQSGRGYSRDPFGSYDTPYTSDGTYAGSPIYDDFKRKHTKADYGDNPPVEIWLEKRIGRIGNYWFGALGGSSKHPTPKGTFTVKSKYEDFYSRKYEAEMPYSVFFTEQCAIHEGSLRVKSHGCIHVNAEAARKIFDHAKTGKSKVKVHP